jgi:hypothetical protein
MVRLALYLLTVLALGAVADAQVQPEPLVEEPQEVIDARPPAPPGNDPRPPQTSNVVRPSAGDVLLRVAPAMDDPQIVQQLLAVDPSRWNELPAPAQLILADTLTRRGRIASARTLYERLATEGNDDSPWRQGARAGLGWIALVQNDREGVRQIYGSDADRGVATPVARVLLALLDAGDARAGAAAELERLSVAADVPPLLREVAGVGVAYAQLWARNYGAARRAFDRVTAERFADDAAYGAAWCRHLDGDDDGARAALRAVAGRAHAGTHRRAALRLVQLEPNAVLRSGLARFRDWHVATGDAWLADTIDLDGVRLARAALRLLRTAEPGAAPAAAEPARVAIPEIAATPQARTRPPADGPTEGSWSWPRTGALVVLVGVVVLAVRRYRVTWGPSPPSLGAAATKRR